MPTVTVAAAVVAGDGAAWRAEAHGIHSTRGDGRGTPIGGRLCLGSETAGAMPNAAAAGQALAVLQLPRAPPRAGARRRDRPRPRAAALERLPPARGAAPTRASSSTCPRSAATAWAWPPSSWARRTRARSRCSGSPGRCSPGSSTRPAHNAHLAVLHGRDVLYVVEERAPGRPPLVTDVGVRLPAHLTASGLAMLAALPPAQVRALFPDRAAFVQRHGVGPRSLPRAAPAAARGYGSAATPHEDGSVTPGFASVAVAVLDHTGHPVAGVAVTYPVHEVAEAERGPLAARVSAAAARALPADPRARPRRRAASVPGGRRAGATPPA